MRRWKWTALVLAVMMLMTAMPFSATALEGFENENCLIIATEPGATSELVEYRAVGVEEPKPHTAMKWVDGGVHGKALSLDGKTDYLQIGYEQLRMAQMTFSTWINFRGSVDASKEAGAYWQRLFTIESGESCYFTVSPHAQDPKLTNDDGHLDGLYMEYFRGDEEEQYSLKSFTGAVADRSHFGLPQNEWHHLAVVVDNISVKMYVDGNLIAEELFLMPIVQMSADSMLIGGGLWGNPLLNALVDEMMLFDKALSAQEIAALMQTGDVASLKNPAAATKSDNAYIPTTVTTTTVATVPTEQPPDKPYAPFGLPIWGFGVCVGVLAVFVLLTVIVNIYEAQFRKGASSGEEDTEPELSVKEFAEQQREEARERFLTEEEREKEMHKQEEGTDE